MTTARSAVVDGLAHLGDERAGVADAGRAAVADEVEAELVEVRREAGPLVVVGDHLRARAPGSSSPTACGPGPCRPRSWRAARPPIITHGLEVLVQRGDRRDGDRAVADARAPGRRGLEVDRGVACRRCSRPSALANFGRRLRDLDPVLRALGAGERRHHGAQVELELLGVARLGVRVVPESLLLGVGLDEVELLLRAPGQLEVLDGLARRSGRPRWWSRTRGSCCRSWRGWPAAAPRRRGRRTRRTSRPPRACAASR